MLIFLLQGIPKYTMFSSALKPDINEWNEAYEQNKSYTMKLTPGSTFLYCKY